MVHHWEKCYCTLREGEFVHYKSGKPEEKKILNLLLATVKLANEDRRFCFDLISPQQAYTLQAESQEEMDKWIAALQFHIAQQLNNNSSASEEKLSASLNYVSAPQEKSAIKSKILEELVQADPSNRRCVDCGAEQPKWASLNFGILFCIECSGIHRSLGTHITKVRSFELDDWDRESISLFKRIGNKRFNEIFECKEIVRPQEWTRNARESFIGAKYRDKKFVNKPENVPIEKLQEQLLEAVNSKDLIECLKLVAQGVNVSQCKENLQGLTPLHFSVMNKDIAMSEFLIQNGCDPNCTDDSKNTPLHFVKQPNFFLTCFLFSFIQNF